MSSSYKCHCCLTQGCTKDIFTEYFCNDQKEVYSEMLRNTLNIIVSLPYSHLHSIQFDIIFNNTAYYRYHKIQTRKVGFANNVLLT